MIGQKHKARAAGASPPVKGSRSFLARSERASIPGKFSRHNSHVPQPSTKAVSQVLRSCISLRITRVIHIAKHPPVKAGTRLACYSLQLVCGAVRRFRENCFLLFEGMHGLVFRRSIHYWQDQPGIQGFRYNCIRCPRRLLGSPRRDLFTQGSLSAGIIFAVIATGGSRTSQLVGHETRLLVDSHR